MPKFKLVSAGHQRKHYLKKILSQDQLVIDIGAKNRFNKHLSQFKNTPFSARYYCTDILPGDIDFLADAQNLPLSNNSVDAVICYAVIEHVPQPWLLASEIYRILKPGGTAYVFAPFLYPYHADPNDYYRFTIDGLRFLFRDFSSITASPVDHGLVTWWRFLLFFKLSWTNKFISKLHSSLENIVGRKLALKQATSYDLWLIK